MTFPTGPLRCVLRQRRLDDAAALVLCRPDDLLEEGVGDAIDVVIGIDHEEVDRSNEAPGPDGRAKGENCPTHHLAPSFGNEDAGLRKVDQLSKQVS